MTASELTVRNLFVTRGGRPVLRDVSIGVPPGEITALLGANGAGKSTLVLAIAGVLPALRGDIFCDGVHLMGRSPDAVRRHGVALVLEGHPVLTGLSVRDNLAAAALMHTRSEAEREIEAALEIFPELRDRLPMAAQNLSGGQKQMVVIAQGMISRPRYLLIDELSFGLAPSIVGRLAETIQIIARRGVGILLIEQNVVHNVDYGIALESENSGHAASYVLARNNVVYYSSSGGLSVYRSSFAAPRNGAGI